jgi:hypothetical protein
MSLGRILSCFSFAASTHRGIEVEATQSNFAHLRKCSRFLLVTGQVSSDGLSVVLHFVGGEARRIRCSSRFLWGVGCIWRILPGVSYKSDAEKIPGDKKHVGGMLS